jgi:seryl-tRNA synthetase
MIDLKQLLKNPEFFKEACKKKNVDVDIDLLVEKKKKQNALIKQRDELKHKLNIKSKERPDSTTIKELKKIKEEIKKLDEEINNLEKEIFEIARKIPNPPLENVPVGKDENDNVVLREVGEKTKFNFEFKDYLTLAEELDIIDVKRASKISGSRFGYLKGKAALLEFALVKFVFDELTNIETIEKIIKENKLNIKVKEFIPIVPPVMIRPEIMWGLGYIDDGDIEVFKIPEDNLVLVGTAEHSLVPYYKDEVLLEKDLPIRFLGFSTCFRREAGSYGKDVRGILRVHQFDKLEMVSFSLPEKSIEEHRFLLAIEEYLMRKLKIPYRVLHICTGDLGHPTAEKFDIEAWIPSENRYRETHSCSNTTDFQARRLNIKFKRKNKLEYVHILNGTAFAIGRTIIAIIENYQTKEGRIKVPEVLIKYTGFDII